MSHWSENNHPLSVSIQTVPRLSALVHAGARPAVHLLWLPHGRDYRIANASEAAFRAIARFAEHLHGEDTLCVLTTPPDAALLLPYLEAKLKFQLWVAVETLPDDCHSPGALPNRHAALLVLTRYSSALRHTKTRIQYTYCPACGKTTKDYGGKKHTYHEYGTLMSDVWRDVSCDPHTNIAPVVERLADLFGQSPYTDLNVYDLRSCSELMAQDVSPILFEAPLPYEWSQAKRDGEDSVEARLIQGDCLETLRRMPAASVDFCFADPPYNLEKKYDTWNDALEIQQYFDWCDEWLAELYRVLKPGRTLCVLNIPLWTVRHFQCLCSVMNYQNWIAWEALGFPVRQIMPSHYALLCFSKGEARRLPGMEAGENKEDGGALEPQNTLFCVRGSCVERRRKAGTSDRAALGDIWSDIHRLKHNSRRVDHPCQLPPALMRRLYVLFTRPGEVVLDCFNGSGTSTLVAQQTGRASIGIELSEPYHRLASSRHEQLARGEDPFGKNDDTPQAKNSRVQRVIKQKYEVSKKTLQLDVRRIARQLGRLPTREEVSERSSYPIAYYDDYFLSWGEACAAARTTGMSELPPDLKPKPVPAFSLFDE